MEKVIFGWIATTFSLIYKLPQIYKLYKTRDGAGVSLTSYILQSMSYVFYIPHSIFNSDYPIMVMSISSVIQCTIIIWYKYNYTRINDTNN